VEWVAFRAGIQETSFSQSAFATARAVARPSWLQSGSFRSPWTNAFVERMTRTRFDEGLRVTGRTTWYLEPEENQRDLDRFLAYYNLERSHQRYRLKGRTPAQALREALGIGELPPFLPAEEHATMPAARDSAEGPVWGKLVTQRPRQSA
jgi:hypothetical protein